MTDTKLLDSKIESSGLRIGFICAKMGISRQGFDNKRKNKTQFKPTEIDMLCELLGVRTITERYAIFFAR